MRSSPSFVAPATLLLLGAFQADCASPPDPWRLTPQSIEKGLAEARRRASPDPLRPAYHLIPPAGFMADPNGGLFHDGWYHLFYMHQPFGGGWYWGHVRSRDLVRWEHLPPNLTPPYERDAWVMFSGSSIIGPTGEPLLFYSAPMEDGTILQLRAVGERDLGEWTHPDPNPVVSIDQPGVPPFQPDWRDPFVFSADGRCFMIL
jgi:beta-fructofuranosidase